MAPVFDHPHERQAIRMGSRRRDAGLPNLRNIDVKRSNDVLSSGSVPRQSRSGPTPLRDGLPRLRADHDERFGGDGDHHNGGGGGGDDDDDDDDDDGDDDRQKNRLQQDPDGDDGDGRDHNGQGAPLTPLTPLTPLNPLNVLNPPTSSSVSPLPAVPAALAPSSLLTLTGLPQPTPAVRTSQLSILATSPVTSSSTSVQTPTPSLLSLPSPTVGTAPAALNPQVVTVSSVTVMTTTSMISLMSTSSSSPISSLFPASTITQSSSVTAALDTLPPSPTVFISDTGDDGSNKHGDSHNDHNGPPPGGLSPTAEDVLISAGSIGAFILICFVCWMGWRMYKKHERAKYGMDGDDSSSPSTLLAKVPYFGRNQRAWQDLDSADMQGSAPMYETSLKSAAMGPTVTIYSPNSRRNIAQPSAARQGPMVLPQLDTNVAFSPSSYTQVNTFSAGATMTASSSSSSGTPQPRSAQSPQNLSNERSLLQANHQYPTAPSHIQTNFSPNDVVNNPFASPEDAVVSADFSPSSTTQYGGEETMQTFATSGTDRSRLPGYFNQSELARTASAAYDPASRAVYRASELSSISSGFGDGDIIVPPPASLHNGQDPRPFSFAKSTGGRSRADSVANRSEVSNSGQRDTMYTTTSEDMPARYRSVNSWVNQQTGRVERQQRQDSDENVPPVPILPPEQRLTMMMDDGEEPRRYEDTLSSIPPVPTLPMQNEGAHIQRPASMSSIEEVAKHE